MNGIRIIGVVLAFALLAAPAAAADGEVLINQAKAEAGGVTPGDGPGFPVSITRPGKYKLTGVLLVPANRNGIAVIVNDVTIDLNGFIMGGALQARNAISAPGIGSLTVMNGTIVEFDGTGILNDTGAWAIVENMRILFNTGNAVALGDYSRLSKSTIFGNTTIGGTGGVFCRVGCLIEQSVIAETRSGPGIILGAGGMVIGNTIRSNQDVGIAASGGVSGFGNNTLTGNNGGGVQVTGNLNRVHPNACSPASGLCP